MILEDRAATAIDQFRETVMDALLWYGVFGGNVAKELDALVLAAQPHIKEGARRTQSH